MSTNNNDQFFPLNTPLVNYFYYKSAPFVPGGPNFPLAGGFLFFFADEDHSLKLDTYSDVFDPDNPVVNPNPIELGAQGDCAPIYLQNRLYYIVLTDLSGNLSDPVATIAHYNPAEGSGSEMPGFNGNFIANGQFTYPLNFFKTTDEEGEITEPVTPIAWAWEFIQDDITTTENIVEFNSVSNEGIEGAPINEVQLTSTGVTTETVKDFRSFVGTVNFLAGQDVTFSAQMKSYISGTAQVELVLEKNYGDGGSPSEEDTVLTFTVTQTRQKYFSSFTMPDNIGKSIGLNNYIAFRLRISLGQICIVGITNALGLPGIVADPVYISQPLADEVSKIVGSTIVIQDAGLAENYSNYMYTDGEIFPYADTGCITIQPLIAPQPFRVPCDGSAYKLTDYSETNIPLKRLYNVIGNTFGGAGDLVVDSINDTIIFQSGDGARENSDYTGGTTTFTVVQNTIGLKLGISGELVAPNQVNVTWVDEFAPNQIPVNTQPFLTSPPVGVLGNWFVPGVYSNALTTATIDPGGVSTQAVASITFNSQVMADYYTGGWQSPGPAYTIRFLEFGTLANNIRGPYPIFNSVIFFSIDGHYSSPSGIHATPLVIVPFLTSLSLPQNIQVFLQSINNPFKWTYTVNEIPMPEAGVGRYIAFSSASADYYAYMTVDGVGSDPAPAGRTNPVAGGDAIALFSTMTFAQVASAIAVALNSLSFSVPAAADLPIIPSDDLLGWYINL